MYVVIKRDGRQVQFDASKIEIAILKAMRYGSGIVNEELAKKIAAIFVKNLRLLGRVRLSSYHLTSYFLFIDYPPFCKFRKVYPEPIPRKDPRREHGQASALAPPLHVRECFCYRLRLP